MSGTTFSHQLKERRLKNALDTVLVRVVAGEETGKEHRRLSSISECSVEEMWVLPTKCTLCMADPAKAIDVY